MGMLRKVGIVSGVAAGVFAAFLLLREGDTGRIPANVVELPAHYEALPGCEKQAFLWNLTESTRHPTLPPFQKLGPSQVLKMQLQSVLPKMDAKSDVAPPGWIKYLHAVGSVAKFSLEPVMGSPYTGLFRGTKCGLIRLSLTYNPVNGSKSEGVAPGAALKFFVDGASSANFSALVSLRPQGDNFNFFEHSLSNIVPPWSNFGARVVHKIFSAVTKYPERLGLRELGETTDTGQREAQVVAPQQVFLVPTKGVSALFAKEMHDVREDFHSLREGEVLYELHAIDPSQNIDYDHYSEADKAAVQAKAVHVANVVLRSGFVSSAFGDAGLFFRHQRFNDQ